MKSTKGIGKHGKGREARKEPCYFFNETEDGCNRGQHCSRYHRRLNPEEKKCHVCGSTKHLADKRDRPKKNDPPPTKGTSKGDKGKSGKGKSKGKQVGSGKGTEIPKGPKEVPEETTIKPPEKLITDNEVLKEELKKIREKTFDSKNELNEFERIMIAALKKEQ